MFTVIWLLFVVWPCLRLDQLTQGASRIKCLPQKCPRSPTRSECLDFNGIFQPRNFAKSICCAKCLVRRGLQESCNQVKGLEVVIECKKGLVCSQKDDYSCVANPHTLTDLNKGNNQNDTKEIESDEPSDADADAESNPSETETGDDGNATKKTVDSPKNPLKIGVLHRENDNQTYIVIPNGQVEAKTTTKRPKATTRGRKTAKSTVRAKLSGMKAEGPFGRSLKRVNKSSKVAGKSFAGFPMNTNFGPYQPMLGGNTYGGPSQGMFGPGLHFGSPPAMNGMHSGLSPGIYGGPYASVLSNAPHGGLPAGMFGHSPNAGGLPPGMLGGSPNAGGPTFGEDNVFAQNHQHQAPAEVLLAANRRNPAGAFNYRDKLGSAMFSARRTIYNNPSLNTNQGYPSQNLLGGLPSLESPQHQAAFAPQNPTAFATQHPAAFSPQNQAAVRKQKASQSLDRLFDPVNYDTDYNSNAD